MLAFPGPFCCKVGMFSLVLCWYLFVLTVQVLYSRTLCNQSVVIWYFKGLGFNEAVLFQSLINLTICLWTVGGNPKRNPPRHKENIQTVHGKLWIALTENWTRDRCEATVLTTVPPVTAAQVRVLALKTTPDTKRAAHVQMKLFCMIFLSVFPIIQKFPDPDYRSMIRFRGQFCG